MLRRNFLTVGSFCGINLAQVLWYNKVFGEQKKYDFMKDEIVDADISFSAEELDAYQFPEEKKDKTI